ncbi:MAG: DUF4340 domain-containing protein [Nitrosomonas sp.]|jgi:hypothetical protein|nr:DUF4340 domain-containing protein [Nitrosomonas sp.]MBP9870089.1 DUF4340 domain-containing protein [Nitrosomonas sp.]
MTYHARLNLIMVTTLIILVTFLYLRPQSQQPEEYSVSSGTVRSAQNIRIVRQEKEIVLKHLDNGWHIIEPVYAFADESKVLEIMNILSATSQQRFPLADLERFSLERPNMQLYIDNEYFGFGGFAPTTNQQYLATGDYVYLISPRYVITLPLEASDMLNPMLLTPNETPVKFELTDLTVAFQNGKWNSTTQNAEQLPKEDVIKHWIQLWQTTYANKITLEQAFGEDFAEIGHIKISLQNGQEISFKVLQNEAEVVILRINQGISYHIPIEVGQQLLDPNAIHSNQPMPGS